MSKRIKEMIIGEVRDRIGDNRDMLVVDSSRLDAVRNNEFRLALRKKGIQVLTVKNALARRALSEAGVTSLDGVLNGPTSLIWGGEDIVALSKEIAKWARDIKEVRIKGGTVEGTPLSSEGVVELSKSPGREELIGRVVMLALSPGAQLSGALLGPGGKVAGQLQALAEKEGSEE